MNWVDIVIVLVLLWFILVGYWRGFIRQALDLTVFIVALLLSFAFYRELSQFIVSSFHIASGFSNAIAFFLVWFIVEAIYYVLFVLFYDRIPEPVRDSRMNRYLGFIPAIIRGSLLIWIVLSLLLILPLPSRTKGYVTDSFIGGPIVKTSPIVEGYIEKVFGQSIGDTITFLTIKPQSNEFVDLGFKISSPKVCSDDEIRMLELVNLERTTKGIKTLTMDENLRVLARDHSTDMFNRGYFAHNTPEGLTPFDRMDKANIKYMLAGENLALAPDVEIAHNGLMNSPGHRANILNSDYGKVGIGCLDGGMYGKMFSQEFTN
jgi:uncharacterized protein YkwD